MPQHRRHERVVVAQSDGDHRCVDVLARALRDDGYEVISAGVVPSAAHLAAMVVQEDADAVALACAPLSGVAEQLRDALTHADLADVTIVAFSDASSPAHFVRGLRAQLDLCLTAAPSPQR